MKMPSITNVIKTSLSPKTNAIKSETVKPVKTNKEIDFFFKISFKSKNASNADKITDNKTKYQSAPEDTYDDTMGVPEQDYEPIDI